MGGMDAHELVVQWGMDSEGAARGRGVEAMGRKDRGAQVSLS